MIARAGELRGAGVPRLYTPMEVAKILKTSRQAVQRLFRERKLSYVEVGKRKRVTQRQLDWFLDGKAARGKGGDDAKS